MTVCAYELALKAAVGAGSGLQADHGVRRTSRPHHRPLEYWRNEKKVFMRAHRSALLAAALHVLKIYATVLAAMLERMLSLFAGCAGLPTVDHIETRSPEPSWPKPSVKKKRKTESGAKRSRLCK